VWWVCAGRSGLPWFAVFIFSVRDDWVSWIDIRTFVNKLFCCLQFSALFVLVGWGSDFLLFCNFLEQQRDDLFFDVGCLFLVGFGLFTA